MKQKKKPYYLPLWIDAETAHKLVIRQYKTGKTYSEQIFEALELYFNVQKLGKSKHKNKRI